MPAAAFFPSVGHGGVESLSYDISVTFWSRSCQRIDFGCCLPLEDVVTSFNESACAGLSDLSYVNTFNGQRSAQLQALILRPGVAAPGGSQPIDDISIQAWPRLART